MMQIDGATIVNLIGDLGAIGLVFWLVYKTTTHTIPRLAKEYSDSEQRQRSDFKEILQQQRIDFLQALERERQFQTNQADRIIEAIRARE
jgi:homospermidine synthase